MLPVLTRREIRRDMRRLLNAFDPKYTIEAALALARWERPALIAWSADDRFFPPEHGRRLAKVIPGARFELIEGARTFSPEDQPERLAELIAEIRPDLGQPYGGGGPAREAAERWGWAAGDWPDISGGPGA